MTTNQLHDRLNHERQMLRNVPRNYFPQDHDDMKAIHRANIKTIKQQIKQHTCPNGMLWPEHLNMCVSIPNA
jgi:hypothetical protein